MTPTEQDAASANAKACFICERPVRRWIAPYVTLRNLARCHFVCWFHARSAVVQETP